MTLPKTGQCRGSHAVRSEELGERMIVKGESVQQVQTTGLKELVLKGSRKQDYSYRSSWLQSQVFYRLGGVASCRHAYWKAPLKSGGYDSVGEDRIISGAESLHGDRETNQGTIRRRRARAAIC